MNLERFKIAQADPTTGFEVAMMELRQGQKVSHWIWYIFPQLRGLGHSPMAQFYAIANEEEARAYLRDPILGKNLLSAMQVVVGQSSKGVPLDILMGSAIDSLKLVSCATLFERVARRPEDFPEVPEIMAISMNATAILQAAEAQGYARCSHTLSFV